MELQKPRQYTGVVAKKIQLTKTVFHFFIRIEESEGFLFAPGQYATFIIDPQTRRQYSFCSAPATTSFELIVDISPMGPGSKYFLEKKEGDKVEYLAPLGNFTLSQNPLKKVLIATGTGIAPFRSMILNEVCSSSLLVPSKKNTTVESTNQEPGTMNIAIYWGLRYEDDVYWDSEFQALQRQYTGFQYFLCLSKPTPEWQGLTGHVTDFVFQNEKNLQNSEFYLCGNSAMITEMKNNLSAQKIKEELIKIDQYY